MNVNVFYLNRVVDSSKLSHILTFSVLNILNNLYTIHGLFGLIIFVILATKFLQLRQQAVVEKFGRLNSSLCLKGRRRLSFTPNAKEERDKTEVARIWREYTHLNGEVIELCNHIKQYSTFWSPYLTVYLAGQISLQCYLAIIGLFATTLPFIQRALALYTFAENALAIFMLIQSCANIVKLNEAIEEANYKFYLHFQQNKSAGTLSSNAVQLLKVRFFK